jgi:hypothetical protein
MTLRDYNARLTIAEALTQFEALLQEESKGGKRKTRRLKKRKGKSRKHRNYRG